MNNEKIAEGQQFALIKLFGKYDRPARLWMLSEILGKEVKTTSELLLSDWRTIRNRAYANWSQNDWTVGESFTKTLAELYDKYEEVVLQQRKLF